jgi:hypothetical protein
MLEQDISFEEKDNTKSVRVDYTVRSDFLNPETLTSEFGIQPVNSFAKGEKYLGKVRDVKTKKTVDVWRTRPWGIWRIDSRTLDPTYKKVEDHLVYLLKILEPSTDNIKKYLAQESKYSITFYIRWEPLDTYGSYEISGKSLKWAGELCHLIEFVSIMPSGDDS